jgi:hypothetical protein
MYSLHSKNKTEDIDNMALNELFKEPDIFDESVYFVTENNDLNGEASKKERKVQEELFRKPNIIDENIYFVNEDDSNEEVSRRGSEVQNKLLRKPVIIDENIHLFIENTDTSISPTPTLSSSNNNITEPTDWNNNKSTQIFTIEDSNTEGRLSRVASYGAFRETAKCGNFIRKKFEKYFNKLSVIFKKIVIDGWIVKRDAYNGVIIYALFIISVWGLCFVIFDEKALPGGIYFSLVILIFSAHIFGFLLTKVRAPLPLGMN